MADSMYDMLKRAKAAAGSAPSAATLATGGAPSVAQIQGLGAAIRNVAPATGPGQGPKASNVQETVARTAADQNLAQIAQQGDELRTQTTQAAQQVETGAKQAMAEESFAELELAEKYAQSERSILEKARQAKEAGNLAEYKAALDQASVYRRLSTEQYVQKLKQEGALARLNTQTGFQEALEEAVFGEELAILKDRLDWESVMASDDREFAARMGQLDLDLAMSIAGTQAMQANTAAQASAVSGLASAGIAAYGADAENQKEQKAGVKDKQAKIDAYKKEQGNK